VCFRSSFAHKACAVTQNFKEETKFMDKIKLTLAQRSKLLTRQPVQPLPVVKHNEKTVFTVQGTVTSQSGTIIPGLRIVIVDKAVGNDLAITETATDAYGGYT